MPRKAKIEKVISLPKECFWVHNGPILSDLKDLHRSLKAEITDEQFAHHVSEGKNDFASWVLDILDDKKCATALKKVKKKSTAYKVVGDCLKNYK